MLFESDDGMTPVENGRRPSAFKMSAYLPNRAQGGRGVKAHNETFFLDDDTCRNLVSSQWDEGRRWVD
ncbi:MAG: hypothetical protein ACWGMY_07340 [Hyphomicrobiaceae bacterium]